MMKWGFCGLFALAAACGQVESADLQNTGALASDGEAPASALPSGDPTPVEPPVTPEVTPEKPVEPPPPPPTPAEIRLGKAKAYAKTFITHVYQIAVPPQAQIDAMAAKLVGATPCATLVKQLATDTPFFGAIVGRMPRDMVTSLFKGILAREPEAAGLNFYTAEAQKTTVGITAVAEMLADSVEAQDICTTFKPPA